MNAPHPSLISLLVVVPLVAWRVYARFRRMVGRQALSRYRPWVHLVMFPALLVLLSWLARAELPRLVWLAAGVACGVLLSVYGLKKTRFEVTPGRLYYTPHAPLGIALSLLFVGRLAYRFLEVYVLEADYVPGITGFVHSPVTLSVFGLLAGYYVGYAAGLVRWRWRILRRKQPG
ncbi:MAG: DUF1453 family protein [Comamonadaceae bacterium]|nr:MAG: DUF1453 family protein [Comamonadaceae bacterium]